MKGFLSRLVFVAVVASATVFLLWFWSRNRSSEPPSFPDERGEGFSAPSREGSDADAEEQATGDKQLFADRAALIGETIKILPSLLPDNIHDAEAIRFWFSINNGFYIEYGAVGVGRAEGMIFVRVSQDGKFQREAAFVLGENDWVSQEGDSELLFTYPRKDLYEKNAAGEWMKVN